MKKIITSVLIGENMKTVCQRFLDSGMTPKQVASRMDVPIQYIYDNIK